MDNLDVDVKASEKVRTEASLPENESLKSSEPARINTQATANYISVMSRQKGLLAESSQRTYNQLSSSLNTYVQDPDSLKDLNADKDSAVLGHYRKLTVQVINRDPSLQEKVAQDLSSAKELVRSRDAASTLEQNMKKLPESLSEGVPAGKNLSKLICQSVVNLTDYENMGAGLQRDLAIREVYSPKSELSLRSKIATSDALSASIAYVKSNQPEVLEHLSTQEPLEKPKPGTSTPQIMTRYLRKALDEFPEGSTYLDIFKKHKQETEAPTSTEEYTDEVSQKTARRIHDLIHKAADTARRGNLIPPKQTAEADIHTAMQTEDSISTDPKHKDASSLSLSELSARAAKLQQQFREERMRLAAEGKLPDPAQRVSLANVDKEEIKKVDAKIEQKVSQNKAEITENPPLEKEAVAPKGEGSKSEAVKANTSGLDPNREAELKAEIKRLEAQLKMQQEQMAAQSAPAQRNTANKIALDVTYEAPQKAQNINTVPSQENSAAVKSQDINTASANLSSPDAAQAKMLDAETEAALNINNSANIKAEVKSEQVLANENNLDLVLNSNQNSKAEIVATSDEALNLTKLDKAQAQILDAETAPKDNLNKAPQTESNTVKTSVVVNETNADLVQNSNQNPKAEIIATSDEALNLAQPDKAQAQIQDAETAPQDSLNKAPLSEANVGSERILANAQNADSVKSEAVKTSDLNSAQTKILEAEVKTPDTNNQVSKETSSDTKAQSQLSADDIKKLALEAVKEALKETVKAQLEVSKDSAKAAASEAVNALKAELEASKNTAKAATEAVSALKAEFESSRNSTNFSTTEVVNELKAQLEASQNTAKAATSEVINELKAQLEASQNNAREMASMVKEALALKAQEISEKETLSQKNIEQNVNTNSNQASVNSSKSEVNTAAYQGTTPEFSNEAKSNYGGYNNTANFDISSYEKNHKEVLDDSLVQNLSEEATKNKISNQQIQLENEADKTSAPAVTDETDKISTAELLRPRVNEDGSEIEENVDEELIQNTEAKAAVNVDNSEDTESRRAEEVTSEPTNELDSEPVINTAATQSQMQQAPLDADLEPSLQQSSETNNNLTRIYSQISSDAKNVLLNENSGVIQNQAPLVQNSNVETAVAKEPEILVQNTEEQVSVNQITSTDTPEVSDDEESLQKNTESSPSDKATKISLEEGAERKIINETDVKSPDQSISIYQQKASLSEPNTVNSVSQELQQNTLPKEGPLPELYQNDEEIEEQAAPKKEDATQAQNKSDKTQEEAVEEENSPTIITRHDRGVKTSGITPKTITASENEREEAVVNTKSDSIIIKRPRRDSEPQSQTQIEQEQNQRVNLEQNQNQVSNNTEIKVDAQANAYTNTSSAPAANVTASVENQNLNASQVTTGITPGLTEGAAFTTPGIVSESPIVQNQFTGSFTTISGVGVNPDTPVANLGSAINTMNGDGITLEQQANLQSRIVAAQNMDDVAADDTPIANPDNDAFVELTDENKGINSDLKTAVQNRPSFLSGLNASGATATDPNTLETAARAAQNLQTKIIAETVPEDELEDSVIPKDSLTVSKTKAVGATDAVNTEFEMTAVPSKTPGAAAITNGNSEPIPEETVVDDVEELREKSGFFSRLASIFSKKNTETKNAEKTQNQTLSTASASAQLMAQNTSTQSPLDAYTSSLRSQINNPTLPQIVRDQARDFLQQLEKPIDDLPSVNNWLNFTSSPLSTTSSMSLALHQWAFLLLSIRFSQLGKSVDKFLKKNVDLMEDRFDDELKKISKELGTGSRGSISSLIDDTFEQVSRFQKPLKENIPALFQYIPLPPSYDGGKEGAFNARPVVDEDGKKSWHLTFVFDLEGIGPIEIKAVAKLPEVKLSVIASSVEGLQKVQEGLPHLKAQLQEAGLTTRSAMARLGNVHIQDSIASPDLSEGENKKEDGATLSVDA